MVASKGFASQKAIIQQRPSDDLMKYGRLYLHMMIIQYFRLALEKAKIENVSHEYLFREFYGCENHDDPKFYREQAKLVSKLLREIAKEHNNTRTHTEQLEVQKLWHIFASFKTKDESKKSNGTISSLDHTLIKKGTQIIIKFIPELYPSLWQMNKLITMRYSYLSYGEFEILRSLMMQSLGPNLLNPTIFSRVSDLVFYHAGRTVRSKRISIKDNLKLRRDEWNPRSLDEIMAISIVELVDRAMYHCKGTVLITEHGFRKCYLSAFIQEIAICAIHRDDDLSIMMKEIIQEAFDNKKLLFSLESNAHLVGSLWGTRKHLHSWYERCILEIRGGLTCLLFSVLYSDYGQFKIRGRIYKFGRFQYVENVKRIRGRIASDEKMFRENVVLFDGLIMKKEPAFNRSIRWTWFAMILTALSAFCYVLIRNDEEKGIFRSLEILSLTVFMFAGFALTSWQVLSGQLRPVRHGILGLKHATTIDDLLNVNSWNRFVFRNYPLITKYFGTEPQKKEEFRKWLACVGFRNQLPGIDMFYSGKERSQISDQDGIRLDSLMEVTLCDGFYIARDCDEMARPLLKSGDGLQIGGVVDEHAIVVSTKLECSMRVGGECKRHDEYTAVGV